MKYAIDTLQKELDLLNAPNKDGEEDDYIDAIIYSRNSADIKLALKILNDFINNTKILRF